MGIVRPRLRIFRREELEPDVPAQGGESPQSPYFSARESAQLEEFCRGLAEHGQIRLDGELAALPGHLRMFIALLAAVGAVQVTPRGSGVEVGQTGRLARHVPLILNIYLNRQHVLIDDWNRPGRLREDRLNAIDLVHYLELRRIDLEKGAGLFPESLAERPSAFGVFRALNGAGESGYLFEVNKDWHQLNFIGGKQEPEDGGDFHRTLLREISEELGISPDRVTLTRLHDRPTITYALTGNSGSLARYPCVMFGVTVAGDFEIRLQDRWITEDTIRHYLSSADNPIMVNPVSMEFLLAGSPSRLERCPLTTRAVIRTREPAGAPIDSRGRRAARFARDNKELLAAVLTLLAALITVVVAGWQPWAG